MPQVEIWIGDVLIGGTSPDDATNRVGAGGGTALMEDAAEKLRAVGPCITSIFSALSPADVVLGDDVGASEFEIEIGFSLEISAGGVLQLFLSPKAGVTYKAKAKWTRNEP